VRILALALLLLAPRVFAASPAPVASFTQLPTGNGFGFSIFDTATKKVTAFLERPYRYLTPGTDPHGDGVYRRDLAYDVYFGVRGGGSGGWLPDQAQSEVGYVAQSGVIRSVGKVGALEVESHYFSPFGLEHNALVMIAKVTNTSGATVSAQVFALPNFRLGAGGDDPSALGETITTSGTHTVETGALGDSGGAVVYVPIGAIAKADCSGAGYAAIQGGGELPSDQRSCSGDDKTLIVQSGVLSLGAGESGSFGLVIGFTPVASGADALGTAIDGYLSGRSADQVLTDALADWESWRKPAPTGLSDDEKRVYRQQETVLRMAQVREPWQTVPKQKGHGMILASLPPGIWHIGWVRDATYAIVALVRSGHLAEARDALRFFLSAEAGGYASYAGGSYRISITRYFGDGQEESDWNADGPNIEFDGWGLYLWALRQYIDAAGDGAILDETLDTGERFADVLRAGVVDPLVRNVEPGGLVLPDTSIWESHWDKRKHYAFTSLAAARGLCDAASIEARYGDGARAGLARGQAAQVRAAVRSQLLDRSLLLGGSTEGLAGGTYHDGAVYEAFNWGLFASDDPIYPATINGLESVLKLPSLGYKRNDDNGSKYDSNEWIFIDSRAAGAYRHMGTMAGNARADELVAWVTSQARANYDLIPELFNAFPEDGPLWSYAGAAPMVGFGAAQYLLQLRERAGESEAQDCAEVGAPDGGAGDGGMTPPSDGGCGCALGRAPVSCTTIAFFAVVGAASLLLALRRRRRR
jgi:GH15 family glucan-1,4-alpha-glucosidase